MGHWLSSGLQAGGQFSSRVRSITLSSPASFPLPSVIGLAPLAQASSGHVSGLLSETVREEGPVDVYVRTSTIHGNGLFARRTFATGETIMFRPERLVTPDAPLDYSKGEWEQHCERLNGGRQVYVGHPAHYVNHSCDPNAFLRRRAGDSYLIALKPIRPHDEILRHYGVDRVNGEAWQCNCGSDRCVGTLPGDFFGLPLEVKVELSPFLSPWFMLEHRQAHRAFLQEAGIPDDD